MWRNINYIYSSMFTLKPHSHELTVTAKLWVFRMEFPDLGQNCHEKNCKQLGMFVSVRYAKEHRVLHNSPYNLYVFIFHRYLTVFNIEHTWNIYQIFWFFFQISFPWNVMPVHKYFGTLITKYVTLGSTGEIGPYRVGLVLK